VEAAVLFFRGQSSRAGVSLRVESNKTHKGFKITFKV